MTSAFCCPSTFPLRRIRYCPTCARRRRISGLDASWYGITWTCCGCGDSWCDGEMLPRPFAPRWREDARRRARKVWDDAGQYDRADWEAWMRAELEPLDVVEEP